LLLSQLARVVCLRLPILGTRKNSRLYLVSLPRLRC
jgi:hypothetical protein